MRMEREESDMICYQDEKLYGPAPADVSPEQLDADIRRLEMEIYGRAMGEPSESVKKPMIYDVTQKQLVEVS